MRFSGTLFAAMAIMALSTDVAFAASEYPAKPVRLTVGFGPGGPSDIAARFMQAEFKAVTGQELIIINKPGAGGAVAWSQINQDEPDGYNLTLVNFPHTVLQPLARGDAAGYTLDDIHPVLFYTAVPSVLMVRAESGIDDVAELLAMMEAKPGEVTFAGTGVGGGNHSAFYKFSQATGAAGAYIPFKDTASTMTAMKGGVTDVAWSFTTQAVQDGDAVRMLAIASEERFPLFPDTPTLTELGYPVLDKSWWAIGVPRETPEEIRAAVAATFARVVADPAVAERMETGGYAPMLVGYPESDALKAQIAADYETVGTALAATN
jgi:tripartite-type tricarboxylate transporter receptor subunit TctC